ncbi:hypothetical protein GCM10012285_21830 [Streptomyces kronopolitis]|uniref:Uncharacterized protein n=1 Tax=Streptomyces kronopolitis TaxID=1612435 RepID=A0ABQ2JBY4_9ACTN|nr:hypothetical protein GCM10012285_21830 [Streptomyces kronopolitis]
MARPLTSAGLPGRRSRNAARRISVSAARHWWHLLWGLLRVRILLWDCRILRRGHLAVGVGLRLGVWIVLFPRYGHGRRLADIAENEPGQADLIRISECKR